MIEGWLIVADDILTLEPRERAAHFWKETEPLVVRILFGKCW
jgi:hypothetical protein